jgi:hypothetical protein
MGPEPLFDAEDPMGPEPLFDAEDPMGPEPDLLGEGEGSSGSTALLRLLRDLGAFLQ